MRVLFISSSRLGDGILSMSLLHHLEREYTNLNVHVVSGPLPAPLFKSIPFCREVLPLVKKPYGKHWIDVWQHFRTTPFDLVIDLRGSMTSFFLRTLKRVIWKSSILPNAHQIERFCALMDLKTPLPPKIWLEKDKIIQAASMLPCDFLAVAPGAQWVGKQWPAERFKTLLQNFQTRDASTPVVLFGAPHEQALVEDIKNALNPKQTHTVISPDLTLVAASLAQAKKFIGNDSGLMHMAAALNIPTIALFGPSDEHRYGPYSASSSPQHSILRGENLRTIEKRPDFAYDAPMHFMDDISVEMVESILLESFA